MKLEETKNRVERNIAISMITSTEYLDRIQLHYKPQLINSTYVRVVATWCMEYFQQYKAAPGKTIRVIFRDKSEVIEDTHTVQLIEKLLTSLSEEYTATNTNVEYLLDQTINYFNKQECKLLSEELDHLSQQEKVRTEDIEYTVQKDWTVPMQDNLDLTTDFEPIVQDYEYESPPLFQYPGKLGSMLNPYLTRNSLIGIQAPEKRGKSYFLLELSMRAAHSRCNVVIFQCGDMTRKQWIGRTLSYLTRKPLRRRTDSYYLPVQDCKRNQNNTCTKPFRVKSSPLHTEGTAMEQIERSPNYKSCTECIARKAQGFEPTCWFKQKANPEPFELGTGIQALRKLKRFMQQKQIRLSTHPTSTLSMQQLEQELNLLERRFNFIPDVVIVDYADIMDSSSFSRETRHQKDMLWKSLRRLSQERHCLVCSATQASARAYNRDTQGMGEYSEDKRVLGHVDAMFGLNQTHEEKLLGIMRVNTIVGRWTEYSSNYTVGVGQDISCSRAYLFSF